MKRNATQGSTSTVSHGRSSAHRGPTYQKVLDQRKRPIRGLWRRGQRYYAQISVPDPLTGKKHTRRVPLKENETGEPVSSVVQAAKELNRLKVQRDERTLPVLRQCPKFSAYVERYFDHLDAAEGKGKRPATIAKEKRILTQWSAHLGETRLDRIHKAQLIAFREKRQKAGMSARTINLDLIALRGCLKLALDEGWLKRLPIEGIRALRTETKKRTLFTLEDIEAVCVAASLHRYSRKRVIGPDEEGKPLKNARQFTDYMGLLALSGARRNEALRLRWKDVDFDRRQLTIQVTKSGKARVVDFNPDLEAHLQDMAQRRDQDSQWLFPSPQRGEQDIPARTFRETLKLAKELAAKTKPELNGLGFHDCRHHFISMAVMANVDFMTIAAWVGHQDGGVLIGKVYGHLANEHRKAMADKLVFRPQALPEGATKPR